MIPVEMTPEDISLAILAMRESAAAGRIATARLNAVGDKRAGAFLAKAGKMEAAADKLEAALLAR